MKYSELNTPRNFRFPVDSSALLDPPNEEVFNRYFSSLRPLMAKCLKVYDGSIAEPVYMIRTHEFIWVIGDFAITKYVLNKNYNPSSLASFTARESTDPVIFEQLHKELFRSIGYKNYKFNYRVYCVACLEALMKKNCISTMSIKTLKKYVDIKSNNSLTLEKHFKNNAFNYNRAMLLYVMFSIENTRLQEHELVKKVTTSYQKYKDLIKEVEKEIFFIN